MANQELDVYVDLAGKSVPVGHVWFTQRRGGPVSSVFAYAAEYLARPDAIALDPKLDLVTGNQYVDGLPGAFQDCAPDRWGRNLIDKRHRRTNSGSTGRSLNDVDYLIEVSDITRQGALRFAVPGESTFVHPGTDVPKLIHLPRLLQASQSIDDSDELSAVKDLLDAGSGSLGGARPKASVLSNDGKLMIAKFPHREDEWDVVAWECVTLDLAEAAGISVPTRNLVEVGESQNALLLERFDRTPNGSRIPYISAMTALSATDGEWHDYAEIAEAISDIGSHVIRDLTELYRRAAFGVAVHNTDDHLRNHGFLAADGGWTLSPMFDVNPNPDSQSRRLTGIAGASHRDEEQAGLSELAGICRLTDETTRKINAEVAEATTSWRSTAARQGISVAEQDRFASVFERTPTMDTHG